MSFKILQPKNIEYEIYSTIAHDKSNPKYFKVAKSIINTINKNNYTIIGSIIHKLITNSKYYITNIDILVDPNNPKLINTHKLKNSFIENANMFNFSKNIYKHDILIINNICINFIYINISSDLFILYEIPYYFLKNFYRNQNIYSYKDNIMSEIRLYCNYNNKIVKKYILRGVKFLSLN